MARCGGHPTVESSITLDLRHLTGAGLASGYVQSGHLQWMWPNSRQPICHVDYQVSLYNDVGTLHLVSITRFDLFGKPVRMEEQTVHPVTITPPYGGRRWWFVCPSTGRRVMKLHLPYAARVFASRQAYRLGYAVQRVSTRDQAYRTARKARKRIGGSPSLTERLPLKPKWMRWATYWRHVEACQKADEQTLKFLVADAEKLLGERITP
jgi:hypothetical protein